MEAFQIVHVLGEQMPHAASASGLTVRDILSHPCIGELAAVLHTRASSTAVVQTDRKSSSSASLSLQARSNRSNPVPLSANQEQMVVLYDLDPTAAAYNELGLVELEGVVNAIELQLVIHALVLRHEVLRSRIYRE